MSGKALESYRAPFSVSENADFISVAVAPPSAAASDNESYRSFPRPSSMAMSSSSGSRNTEYTGSSHSSISQFKPSRALKRAAALLTTTGKPSEAVRGVLDVGNSTNLPGRSIHDDDANATGALLRRHSVNLGKSIKRKLKGVSSAWARRSMSVSYAANELPISDADDQRQKGPGIRAHRRTRSDVIGLDAGGTILEQDLTQCAEVPGNLNIAMSEAAASAPAQYTEFRVSSPVETEHQFPSPKSSHSIDEPSAGFRALDQTTPPINDSLTTESLTDVVVPQLLQQGTPLLKMSNKKQRHASFVFRLDADQGRIVWESKVSKFIPVENIKEIRTGHAAFNHVSQFQFSPVEDYLPRWLTLIYIGPPSSSKTTLTPLPLGSPKSAAYSVHTYKTLHVMASSSAIVQMWEHTLKAMVALRVSLMHGLGFGGGVNRDRSMEEMRQALWERSFWTIAAGHARGTSSRPDPSSASGGAEELPGLPVGREEERLSFPEMQNLCERLNVRMAEEEVRRLFDQADIQGRQYLDFNDFRRFGKLLKARPELRRLYKSLVRTASGGEIENSHLSVHGHRRSVSGSGFNHDSAITYEIFERFMREYQKSTLPSAALRETFGRHSVEVLDSLQLDPSAGAEPTQGPRPSNSLLTPHYSPSPPPSSSSLSRREVEPDISSSLLLSPSNAASELPSATRIMTQDTFTSFLLSADNPTCLEKQFDADVSHTAHGHVPSHLTHDSVHPNVAPYRPLSETSHDMTRPLSEYYISSSHNTYLIGHQLVGESTVEGYVRALLGGCRSVELDIFDTDTGPQIFHGKTFTSKVSLREVCEVIMTYGFVASDYPIIISAEMHCGLAGQIQLVEIMKDVFGDKLVRRDESGNIVGINGSESQSGRAVPLIDWKIENLPSPAELKGKILVKTKNLLLSERKGSSPSTSGNLLSSSLDTSTSSTSDTDAVFDLNPPFLNSRRSSGSKAREILQRVRSRGKSASDANSPPSSYSPRRHMSAKASSRRSSSPHSKSSTPTDESRTKPKMSQELLSLLVYTVGVKCRGINKKEVYAPEEMFSLSEKMANKMLKVGMIDLIKHTRGHLVRIYPRGSRVNSTNYEPYNYWSAGAQLVAINWQTVDLGYMINHAMFQRNGGCGYVLKPLPLRIPHKETFSRQTQHNFDVTIISAQHLPAPKDASGREISEKLAVNPYVQVTLHVPEWPTPPPPSSNSIASGLFSASDAATAVLSSPGSGFASPPSTPNVRPVRSTPFCTSVVKNNGFNPVWEETLRIPFTCVGDMKDLIFVKFAIRHSEKEDTEPLAQFHASLGCLQPGYRHLPLYDSQMSQYLFSTLFVRVDIS